MEPNDRPLRFRLHALDDITWAEIKVSKICFSIRLVNRGAGVIKLRTDSTDPNSEQELFPGEPMKFDCLNHPFIPTIYAMAPDSVGPLAVEEITNGVP